MDSAHYAVNALAVAVLENALRAIQGVHAQVNYADHERAAAHRASMRNALRDVIGNPFRPVLVDSTWLTSTVTGLAQSIYDNRSFDQLPILADALEEGGCPNETVLNHCRQPGVHVRGCWVIDLLLGKD